MEETNVLTPCSDTRFPTVVVGIFVLERWTLFCFPRISFVGLIPFLLFALTALAGLHFKHHNNFACLMNFDDTLRNYVSLLRLHNAEERVKE